MKIEVVLLFLILSFNGSKAQNLVPNPDFEDTLYCPTAPAGFAKYWSSCKGSPDYFNSCGPSCLQPQTCVGVPNNYVGTQYAYSGNAYSGLETAGSGGLSREILIIQLVETLQIGKKYNFSCYISRAFSIGICQGASNNFGFRFSTVEFDYINEVSIDNYSNYRDTAIISDTTNWTLVEGSFIADSSYKYLMLGNFYDDNNTDTINMAPTTTTSNFAYYYVDNVCVTPDSANCSFANAINNNAYQNFLMVYPNPFKEEVYIKLPDNMQYELIIYDITGRRIITKFINYDSYLDLSSIDSGVYIYSILRNKICIKNGKLLKK